MRGRVAEIDIRRVVLSQFIDLAFLQTRKRDWTTPGSRSPYGVSKKIVGVMKLLVDASLELSRCELSNGQLVPSNEFSTKLAHCLFEVLGLVGGLRVDHGAWITKVLGLLDRRLSGEHEVRR